MSDSKKCCFVIDWNSIRGSKNEVSRLNLLKMPSHNPSLINQDSSLRYEGIKMILYLIVTKIQDNCNKKEIILYFRSKCTYSSEIKLMMENDFVFKSVKLLIGQQSLFLFIGYKLNDFSSVCWLSNEWLFLSKNLIETISIIENKCQWKVFSPLKYENAIKHDINY